jgi:adenylyltransferase/sulfurtransferase
MGAGAVSAPGELTPARRLLGARTALLAGRDGNADDTLRRLANTSVLVVGAGGLGSPVIALLAGSGLGRITIVDPDVVDPTNLARQTLFTREDLGQPKAVIAAEHVRAVDAEVTAVAVVAAFAESQVHGHDIVVDAADSVLVTRAISDACATAGVPFIWGTALGYDGQVSSFWDAEGIDFHDLHPEPLADEGSCAVDGVLPALCHAIGSVMAAQVTALVAGLGEPLLGSVLTVDARRWRWTTSPLRRAAWASRPAAVKPIASIDVQTLRESLEAGSTATILDVRTPGERSTGTIPGAVSVDELTPTADEIVVVCERGPRATQWVLDHPDVRAVVLEGGMQAWRAMAEAS